VVFLRRFMKRPRLGHDRFLLNTFQFIIYQPFYHFSFYSVGFLRKSFHKQKKTNNNNLSSSLLLSKNLNIT
jgi:hypothetical protein